MNFTSTVNSNISFRQDQVALTIVNAKGGFHAKLIHEFFCRGQYQIFFSDLIGDNKSHIGEVRHFPFDVNSLGKYDKSKTWIVGIREFERMRANIIRERDKAEIPYFQNVGKYSDMRITIRDYQTANQELVYFKELNPIMFNEFCKSISTTIGERLPFNEDASEEDIKKIRKNAPYSSNSITKLMLTMLDGTGPWKETKIIQKSEQGSNATTDFVRHYPGLWDIRFVYKDVVVSSQNKIKSIVHLFKSIREEFSRYAIYSTEVTPNNCSTWVIEKLQLAGVPVKTPTWHFVVSGPQELVRENQEANVRPADCVIC